MLFSVDFFILIFSTRFKSRGNYEVTDHEKPEGLDLFTLFIFPNNSKSQKQGINYLHGSTVFADFSPLIFDHLLARV